MPAIDIGRICVKIRGREAGRRCVIVDIIDRNYALVTGPKNITGVRRRRVNINHLKLTEDVIKIRRGASDEEVYKAIVEAGLIEKYREVEKKIARGY
ncbi:MAG: 50S ribosomal protein L14e [Candidatus Bathyarchaeia archaeon]|nr:50S ribosomal protein L14e [Candidatus Bathyarchaeota archaeon]